MSRKPSPPASKELPKKPVNRPDASTVLLIGLLLLIPFIGGYVLMEPYGAKNVTEILVNMFGVGKDLNMAIGVSLVLVGIAYLVNKPMRSTGRHALVLGSLAVWIIICTAMSPYHADALRQAGGWLAVLAVISIVSRMDAKSREWLTVGLVVAGCLVGFVAVREYMANLRGAPEWRVFGPFQSPNILAAYLCLIIPLTLSWLSRVLRSDLRLLVMIGWGLQVSALVLTGSRFGILSAAIGVFVWLVWMSVRRQWDRASILGITRAVALGLVLAVLCTSPLRNRMGTIPAAGAQEHSGQFRVTTWKGTVNMVKAHPITGVGAGCFAFGYSRTAITGFTRTAHQSYLQLASEMGIPGLVLWLGVGFGGLIVLIRNKRVDLPVPLLAGAASGVIASGCHAMMDSDWQMLAVLVTLSVLIGLCYGPSAGDPNRRTSSLRDRAAGSVALLFGVWIIVQAYHAQIGQYAFLSGDAPTARASNEAILSLCPFDGTAMMNIALVQAADPAVRSSDKIALLRSACTAMPTPRNYMMAAKVAESLADLPDHQFIAADFYQKLIEIDPVSPRGYVRYGDLLERMGRRVAAGVIYQRLALLEKSPAGRIRAVPELPETDYAFGYGGLARLAIRDGKQADAARYYSEALRVITDDRVARTHNVAMSNAKPREMNDQLDALEREAKGFLRQHR